MGLKNKGFTLVEVIAVSLILGIVFVGLGSSYIAGIKMYKQAAHRLEAAMYIRNAAESLLAEGDAAYYNWSHPAPFSIGQHTASSDPKICTIPDGYFKNSLNGKLSYSVDEITVNNIKGRRILITASWFETSGTSLSLEKKESLCFIAYFYNFTSLYYGPTPWANNYKYLWESQNFSNM